LKLLLLGGTADARKIASVLTAAGIEVIYSIAGLVRKPEMHCAVLSGGFSKRGGLAAYMQTCNIDAILDATHPYAIKMSSQALRVCNELAVKYWRFNRQPWQPREGDQWLSVANWQQLITSCSAYHQPFLTTGQLQQAQLDSIASNSEQVLYRTAAAAQASLAANVKWLKAIGPFDLHSELALLDQYNIDVLICKNAGGIATYAKLVAARHLQIPVIMLARPAPIMQNTADQFSCIETITQAVIDRNESMKSCQ